MKKDLLTLLDLEKKDFEKIFEHAAKLKTAHKSSVINETLKGKTIGLLFDKASTRTRVSFEAAAAQLGAFSMFISAVDTQISRNEPVQDTARVLSRYLNCLAIRTYSQKWIEDVAKYADIPVINALTDLYHPTQIIADLFTIIEYKGGCDGIKIAWIGDGNNMANSWINAAAVLGFKLSMAFPEKYFPQKEILDHAVKQGAKIEVSSDPYNAVKDADVINTDVWASMGMECEQEERKNIFADYQVNEKLLEKAKKDYIIMHCLPAHRGEEITESVLEGEHSAVWEQSENKLHAAKAIFDIFLNR